MGLQQDIQDELKVSIKAKDADRTSAIRILIGEFQRQPQKELSDEQVIAIIKKMIKYERELLASSGKEGSGYLSVLENYLPQQASEEEIKAWIVAHINFDDFNNKMQAMRPVMAHFGSSADGNVVKKILMGLG